MRSKVIFGIDFYLSFRHLLTNLRISETHKKIRDISNITSEAIELSDIALEKFNQGKYLEAKEIYDQALLKNPRNVEVLHKRGIACIKLNMPVEAVLSFDRILEFMPDPTILILKGEVLLKEGDALNALDCFQTAINISAGLDRNLQEQTSSPEASIAIAHLYSAYAWEDVGDIAEAVISYRKALIIDPTKGDYHYFLAKALYHLDEYDDAFKEIELACQLEPNFDTYLLQAKLNLNNEDYQGALDSLNCISANQIKESDQMWEYYGVKGLALWNISLFHESLESINTAIENYKATPNQDDESKGSNKAILIHNRGAVYLSLNQIDMALENFKIASELDPGNPEHLNKFNEVLATKDKQKANLE